MSQNSAIHLYAWDDHDPSFMSIDISTSLSLDVEHIQDHIARIINVELQDIVYKYAVRKNTGTWIDLCPDILRQRLSIHGKMPAALTPDTIREFLMHLCPVLDMKPLSEPIVAEHTAWVHWETSGVLLHWDNTHFLWLISTPASPLP